MRITSNMINSMDSGKLHAHIFAIHNGQSIWDNKYFIESPHINRLTHNMEKVYFITVLLPI